MVILWTILKPAGSVLTIPLSLGLFWWVGWKFDGSIALEGTAPWPPVCGPWASRAGSKQRGGAGPVTVSVTDAPGCITALARVAVQEGLLLDPQCAVASARGNSPLFAAGHATEYAPPCGTLPGLGHWSDKTGGFLGVSPIEDA